MSAVQCGYRVRRRGPLSRGLMGGALLVLWAVSVAVGASSDLHQRLHSDANSGQHVCLVTVLQQNGVLTAALDAELACVVPPLRVGRLRAESVGATGADFRVSLSRAPPLVFSLL